MIKKIKPGDIVLIKRYNVFKRIWYKLRNKKLQYNYACMSTCDNTVAMDRFCSLLALKKPYTRKEEIKMLQRLELAKSLCSAFPIVCLDKFELAFVVNGVRPNTLKSGSVNELLNSEYYKHEEN